METITSSRDIDELFKHGRRASHPLIVLLCARTPEDRSPAGRVVFVAGRKIGGAVVRNRCKRVLREACRRAGGPWAGRDVALIARAAVATASPAELDAALAELLVSTGVVP